MTSSLRRKHPITAPTTRVATRPDTRDLARAILITVAIFAAIVGTLAHAAFGADARPSSRRVQNQARTQVQPQTKPAEFRPREIATPVPAKKIETFVVKSSTISSPIVEKNTVEQASGLYPKAKRFVGNSTEAIPAEEVVEPSTGLKWRTPTRQFQSQVAPVSYEEDASPSQRQPRVNPREVEPLDTFVQQAQASRFADPEAPAIIPPTGAPAELPPLLPSGEPNDLPPTTNPPSALDDLIPSELPEIDPLPGPDLPPILPEEGVKAPPCKEVYRDTDCCKQSKTCQAALDAVERNHLRDFPFSFLDITPRYQPDLRPTIGPRKAEDDARRKGLGLLEPRAWHNRAGEQIAHGRFVDYQWGRIIIQGRDGTTEVPMTELAADELCYVRAYWGDGVGLPEYCRIEGRLPDYYHMVGGQVMHDFTLTTFHWKASALCHKPLYFEEVQLERYGHSHGPLLQPIVSTGHFFVNIAILPYKMGINPPNECMYALGYYRPGNCAPYMIPPVPYSLRGAAYQGLAVGGGIAIFP